MLLVARHEMRQAWRSKALVAFALVAAGLFVTAALFDGATTLHSPGEGRALSVTTTWGF
jgi:hypothetical protein